MPPVLRRKLCHISVAEKRCNVPEAYLTMDAQVCMSLAWLVKPSALF